MEVEPNGIDDKRHENYREKQCKESCQLSLLKMPYGIPELLLRYEPLVGAVVVTPAKQDKVSLYVAAARTTRIDMVHIQPARAAILHKEAVLA